MNARSFLLAGLVGFGLSGAGCGAVPDFLMESLKAGVQAGVQTAVEKAVEGALDNLDISTTLGDAFQPTTDQANDDDSGS